MPAGQTAEAELSIYVLIRRRFLALDFISLRGSSVACKRTRPHDTPIEEEEESGKKGLIFNSNVMSISLSLSISPRNVSQRTSLIETVSFIAYYFWGRSSTKISVPNPKA